jgi:uncharacterized membrane protein YeaQ/YmgE (transglycosylase-associated protein family)
VADRSVGNNAGERLVIGFILFLLIIGLIAGFLARLLVPGRDPMGILQTILLGIVGSFIGGFLGYVLFHKDGAIIALLIWRAMHSRSRTAAH